MSVVRMLQQLYSCQGARQRYCFCTILSPCILPSFISTPTSMQPGEPGPPPQDQQSDVLSVDSLHPANSVQALRPTLQLTRLVRTSFPHHYRSLQMSTQPFIYHSTLPSLSTLGEIGKWRPKGDGPSQKPRSLKKKHTLARQPRA